MNVARIKISRSHTNEFADVRTMLVEKAAELEKNSTDSILTYG
jgi:hypothetical protein